MIDSVRSWLLDPRPVRVGNPPPTNPPAAFCTRCGGRIKIHGHVIDRRFDKDTGAKTMERIDWLWRCETLDVLNPVNNQCVRMLDYGHDWYEVE